MVTASPELVAVGALRDGPLAVIGDDKSMQVEIKAVLHSGTVERGHQAACLRQCLPVKSDAFAERSQFLRRAARMLAAPKVLRPRKDPVFGAYCHCLSAGRHASRRIRTLDGSLNRRTLGLMRLFLVAFVILILCAADRAYMDGKNMSLAVSAARSVGATVNRQLDDLLRYLKK
jgi:hypothetical protein